MTDPKHKVGDKVNLRYMGFNCDGCIVLKMDVVRSGDVLEDDNGTRTYLGPDYISYVLDVDPAWYPEMYIFPYQEPGDDFKTILAQVSDPSTITNPATGPILEPA